MRRYMYTVMFDAKDKDGKLYTMAHTEDIFAVDEVEAITRAMKQIPIDVLRRPVVSMHAYRDMRRA